MSEAQVKRDIMLALSRGPVRLFNNPVGSGWLGDVARQSEGMVTLRNARRVAFGLFPGSADLIGWKTCTITESMIGRMMAEFVSLEVKENARVHGNQHAWAAAVQAAGGIAGVVRSPDQARVLLRLPT